MSDPTFTAEGREILCRLAAWEGTGGAREEYGWLLRHLLDTLGSSPDAAAAAGWPPLDTWDDFYKFLALRLYNVQHSRRWIKLSPDVEIVAWVAELHRRMRENIIPVADLDLVMRQIAYRDKHRGEGDHE